MTLRHVVIAYETPQAATSRLIAHGYAPDIAGEIAIYLAQSNDISAFFEEIGEAVAGELSEAAVGEYGISTTFAELDELPAILHQPDFVPADSLLWNLTDGIRFYRGSTVPALARLHGIPRYGSSPTAQHICQDKFLSGSIAYAAGLPCPPTKLFEGADELGQIGAWPDRGPFFVKPSTLGAKIGIFADSRCATLEDARALSARLWDRYRDRAVVQPFVAGDDIRVSFMNTGRPFRDQLGIFRLAKNAASETGGAFMTMKDNETLSGLTTDRAFVPTMLDLRTDATATGTVAAIEDAAERLARLLGLSDCFSMDFRVDSEGQATFFEFEVCPAVTIYDFQAYLRGVHGLTLGDALAKSFRLAHGRAGGMGEA